MDTEFFYFIYGFQRSDVFHYNLNVFRLKNILPFFKATWDEVHSVFAQSISIVKRNGIHLQRYLCHRGDINVNPIILPN